jgi:uncharacterized protein YaiL (DUF2058 family)
MSDSLRDQLLKAGFVTQQKVKKADKAEEQRRRQMSAAARAKVAPAPPPASAAQQAQARKVARDMELNRRQQEKAQRRALRAQVEQLVEQSRLPRLESEDFYSFIDGGKIRRVAVDAQRRKDICEGRLKIVRYRHHHEVVPADAAQRIQERDATAVLLEAESRQSAVEEDDPYKDFVVPDDLIW